MLKNIKQIFTFLLHRLTLWVVAGTMNKALGRLQKAGLLEKYRVGNQLQFCANVQHPVFAELSALLRKTIGLADVLISPAI